MARRHARLATRGTAAAVGGGRRRRSSVPSLPVAGESYFFLMSATEGLHHLMLALTMVRQHRWCGEIVDNSSRTADVMYRKMRSHPASVWRPDSTLRAASKWMGATRRCS